jgi:hypothetical protein
VHREAWDSAVHLLRERVQRRRGATLLRDRCGGAARVRPRLQRGVLRSSKPQRGFGEPVNTRAPRFAVVSPQMTVDLPPDNILGVPPQTATFVAAGWAMTLRRLLPGEHIIEGHHRREWLHIGRRDNDRRRPLGPRPLTLPNAGCKEARLSAGLRYSPTVSRSRRVAARSARLFRFDRVRAEATDQTSCAVVKASGLASSSASRSSEKRRRWVIPRTVAVRGTWWRSAISPK